VAFQKKMQSGKARGEARTCSNPMLTQLAIALDLIKMRRAERDNRKRKGRGRRHGLLAKSPGDQVAAIAPRVQRLPAQKPEQQKEFRTRENPYLTDSSVGVLRGRKKERLRAENLAKAKKNYYREKEMPR